MPDLGLPDKEFNHLSKDERFLRKLKEIVQSNLANEQFGVESLAEAIGISRIQLYRKLQRITGKNVSQYIREIRLELAMNMLKENVANVSEIAYEVGFGSPAYFNKCFHDFYGYPPGEVIKRDQQNQESQDEVITREGAEDKNTLIRKKNKIFNERHMLYVFIIFFGASLIIIGVNHFIKVNRVDFLVKEATEKTIAVLPFRNDSPDPDYGYFLNGMQEEISNQLQKIKDLIVRPRQSVEQYRNTEKDIPSIGKELNVAYILESSGRLFRDTVRMWIKLTNVKTNIQIWGEAYNVPYTTEATFDLQGRIAKTVAASLGAVITPDEEKRIDSRHVVPVEALRLNMKARRELNSFWDGLGQQHIDSAMELYNQALAIDPEFTFAIAAKGEVFLHRDRNFDSAIYYCKKAIKLDPEEGFGYWILGTCYKETGLFDLSIENFLKATELLPHVPGPHMHLGSLYITKKQNVKAGLPHLIRSLELRPLDELNQLVASECYYYIGDYEKAKEHAMNSFILGEKYTCWGIRRYHMALSARNTAKEELHFLDSICKITNCNDICNISYWYLNLDLNDFEQAEKDYDQLMETGDRFLLFDSIYLAYMYKQLGRYEDYQKIIDYCRTRCEDQWKENKEDFNNIGYLIPLYAILDEKEKALRYLSEFEKTGFHFNIFSGIESSPIFENIRDDPEYDAIIERVQDKEATLKAQIKKMEEGGLL
jgi:TolB-like protein/AraC-like DNA-binding protein